MTDYQKAREATWAIACATGNAMWGACRPDRVVVFAQPFDYVRGPRSPGPAHPGFRWAHFI